MEAIACARLRLLTAQRRFEDARDFARGLRDAAAGRSLRRTLMRALALSARLEHEAGDPAAAAGHLAEALRLLQVARATRGRWPASADAVVPLLERLVDAEPPGSAHSRRRPAACTPC